ncbi:hypothetical protein BH11PLA2_BH11PLA2_04490 [soil metagenome]
MMQWFHRRSRYRCGGCGRDFGLSLPWARSHYPLCNCENYQVLEPSSTTAWVVAIAIRVPLLLVITVIVLGCHQEIDCERRRQG